MPTTLLRPPPPDFQTFHPLCMVLDTFCFTKALVQYRKFCLVVARKYLHHNSMLTVILANLI